MTLNPQNERLTQQIINLEARIDQLQKEMKFKNEQIMCLNDTIITLKDQLQYESEKTVGLQKILESKEKELFEAGGQNLAKDNLLEQRQAEISKYKNQINHLQHKLLNNADKQGLPKELEIPKVQEATSQEKIVKLSSLQISELDRLIKENKRLADENSKLSNQLRQLSKDQFLTKASEKTILQTQVKGFDTQSHQPNFQKTEITKNDQNFSAKQEQSGQEAPKKRKLMRKPRIQVDIDTFEVTPVNI